jgi:hypothetical protein
LQGLLEEHEMGDLLEPLAAEDIDLETFAK